jgi:hypothetical protein
MSTQSFVLNLAENGPDGLGAYLAWISTAGESPNGGFAHLIHLTQEFGPERYPKW